MQIGECLSVKHVSAQCGSPGPIYIERFADRIATPYLPIHHHQPDSIPAIPTPLGGDA
jgi:hypothetical protein